MAKSKQYEFSYNKHGIELFFVVEAKDEFDAKDTVRSMGKALFEGEIRRTKHFLYRLLSPITSVLWRH